MELRVEKLKNLIEFITAKVMNGYYGEIKVKMNNGDITIAEKIDKIKLDNLSYSEYKSNNK